MERKEEEEEDEREELKGGKRWREGRGKRDLVLGLLVPYHKGHKFC